MNKYVGKASQAAYVEAQLSEFNNVLLFGNITAAL